MRRAGFWLSLKLIAGDRVIADDSYRVLGGEVHRRIALSDPGVDDFRNELLWSPSNPMLHRRAARPVGRPRRARRLGPQLHRAAVGGRPGRSLPPERPAVPAANGSRPGLLAGHGRDAAVGRRAALRRRARAADGLQRRAQAPEDRGAALPLLGGPPRPAGLGGDAERLSLHAALDRARHAGVAGAPSRGTTATRASSRGCRSTSRGEFRTCPTAPRSGTTCRRSTI